MIQMRDAVHCDFERNRDLLLHFFGGAARPLRDDLDVIVGDVGVGFHRKVVEGDRAPNQQQQGWSTIRNRLLRAKSTSARIIWISGAAPVRRRAPERPAGYLTRLPAI